MYISPVTQKGQVTIPAGLRTQFGVRPYGKVKIEPGNGYIKITATEDILDLAGSVKPIRGRSALKARAWMEKHYTRN